MKENKDITTSFFAAFFFLTSTKGPGQNQKSQKQKKDAVGAFFLSELQLRKSSKMCLKKDAVRSFFCFLLF